MTVTFTNSSTNATTYEWNFGDGTASAVISPTHSYSQTGVYTVSLAAGDGVVTDTLTRTNYITVSAPVTAGFSAFPTSGPAPLIVSFFDNSNNASSYLWDFGDGLTSTISSPVHTYSLTGVYTVSQTVSGPGGSDILTKTNYITVTQPVMADFSASPVTGTVPLIVTFVNSSTGATNYEWHFGDGITSHAANPTHIYIQAGTYTVTLAAGDGLITDTLTRTNYIVVSNQANELIQVGETWRYFKGTQAPPANWTEPSFDDSGWLAGATGIGYGDGDDATELTDMKNNYLTVFARKVFTLTNPAAVISLAFEMDYDDGFVTYLNGTPVITENVSSSAYDAEALTEHEAGVPVLYDLSSYLDQLQAGVNVLAGLAGAFERNRAVMN